MITFSPSMRPTRFNSTSQAWVIWVRAAGLQPLSTRLQRQCAFFLVGCWALRHIAATVRASRSLLGNRVASLPILSRCSLPQRSKFFGQGPRGRMSASGQATSGRRPDHVLIYPRERTSAMGEGDVREVQPASNRFDATQALNLSAGVSNCKVSRGRSLS